MKNKILFLILVLLNIHFTYADDDYERQKKSSYEVIYLRAHLKIQKFF